MKLENQTSRELDINFQFEEEQQDEPKQLKADAGSHPTYKLFNNFLKGVIAAFLLATVLSIVSFVLSYKSGQVKDSSKDLPFTAAFLLSGTLSPIAAQRFVKFTVEQYPVAQLPPTPFRQVILNPGNIKLSHVLDKKFLDSMLKQSPNVRTIQISTQRFTIHIADKPITETEAKEILIIIDGLIIAGFLLCLLVIQFRANRIHKNGERPELQQYSLKITNLPKLAKYKLLPKLKKFIEDQVTNKYSLILQQEGASFDLFDVECSYNSMEIKLQNLIEKSKAVKHQITYAKKLNLQKLNPEDYQRALLKIRANILKQEEKIAEKQEAETQCVWITCRTRNHRFMILETFKMNSQFYGVVPCFEACFQSSLKHFQGHVIHVDSAPQPWDTLWKNLYVGPGRRMCAKFTCLVLCGLLLLASNVVVLVLHMNELELITPIAVIGVNVILKMLLRASTLLEKHLLRAAEKASNMKKITIAQFLNMAVVVFLSSFRAPSWFPIKITLNKYDEVLDSAWMNDVGLTVIRTLLLAVVTSNLIIVGPPLLKGLLQSYDRCFSSNPGRTHKKSFQQYLQLYQPSPAQIQDYYADLLTYIFVCLCYGYLLPILYPITLCIVVTNFFTFKFLFAKIVSPPVYYTNKLSSTASKFLFLAIAIHILVVYFAERRPFHLILALCLGTLYLCRQLLFNKVVKVLNRLLGPIFGTVVQEVENQAKSKPISEVFSRLQKSQKVKQLERRRTILKQHMNKAKIVLNDEEEHMLRKYDQFLQHQQREVCGFNENQQGLVGGISYSFMAEHNVESHVPRIPQSDVPTQ